MQNKAIEAALAEVHEEVDGLEEELARLENKVSSLENDLESQEVYNEKLLNDISALHEYVKELETALAESYLMSADDGPEDEECDPTKS